MISIELQHKKNFEIIKKNNLKIGTILKHKTQHYEIIITHIHSKYGWVKYEHLDTHTFYIGVGRLHQNMSNINKFYIQHKIRGEIKWETKK